jgi:hypothetical protein
MPMTTTVADVLVSARRRSASCRSAETTLAQMKHLAEALIRGEPNRQEIALTALADKVREII